MPRLPRITGPELVRALKKMGFVEHRQKGSHLTLKHLDTGRRVVVPIHVGKTLALGTLKAILKQAGISVEELKANL